MISQEMLTSSLEASELVEELATHFGEQFTEQIQSWDHRHYTAYEKTLRRLKKKSGIYAWVATIERRRFVVYIGQTKDLLGRLKNYCDPFQPHSTNDFKMQVCQRTLTAVAPEATLSFHTHMPPDLSSGVLKRRKGLHAAETELIKHYRRPWLNRKGKATPESLHALATAWSDFYEHSLAYALQNAKHDD